MIALKQESKYGSIEALGTYIYIRPLAILIFWSSKWSDNQKQSFLSGLELCQSTWLEVSKKEQPVSNG